MKTPTIDPALVSALKRLKLGHIADTLPERIVLAEKQSMPVQELMLLVLSDEIARRESSSTERRAKDAELDPTMQLERWDKSAKVTYDKRVFAELMSLRFVEAHQHVIILGPVGVGKTFLATALGHVACRHRYQVAFTRADEMLRKLRQSRLDNSRDVLMMQLCTVDLLIIDSCDVPGYVESSSRLAAIFDLGALALHITRLRRLTSVPFVAPTMEVANACRYLSPGPRPIYVAARTGASS